jgi:hypothetical protein
MSQQDIMDLLRSQPSRFWRVDDIRHELPHLTRGAIVANLSRCEKGRSVEVSIERSEYGHARKMYRHMPEDEDDA